LAKEIHEIRNFQSGTITSPDIKDIPDDAASYSLNLDSVAKMGVLSSVPTDSRLYTSTPVDNSGNVGSATFTKTINPSLDNNFVNSASTINYLIKIVSGGPDITFKYSTDGGTTFSSTLSIANGSLTFSIGSYVSITWSGFDPASYATNDEYTFTLKPNDAEAVKMDTINSGSTTDLVYFGSDDQIKSIADIHGKNTSITTHSGGDHANSGDIAMERHNKEIHIGLGGGSTHKPQWAGYINKAQFGGSEPSGIQLDDAECVNHATFTPITHKAVTVGNYVYIIEWKGNSIYKYNKSDLSFVKKSSPFFKATALCAPPSGTTHIYVFDSGAGSDGSVSKVTTSDLEISDSYPILGWGASGASLDSGKYCSDMIFTNSKLWFSIFKGENVTGAHGGWLKDEWLDNDGILYNYTTASLSSGTAFIAVNQTWTMAENTGTHHTGKWEAASLEGGILIPPTPLLNTPTSNWVGIVVNLNGARLALSTASNALSGYYDSDPTGLAQSPNQTQRSEVCIIFVNETFNQSDPVLDNAAVGANGRGLCKGVFRPEGEAVEDAPDLGTSGGSPGHDMPKDERLRIVRLRDYLEELVTVPVEGGTANKQLDRKLKGVSMGSSPSVWYLTFEAGSGGINTVRYAATRVLTDSGGIYTDIGASAGNFEGSSNTKHRNYMSVASGSDYFPYRLDEIVNLAETNTIGNYTYSSTNTLIDDSTGKIGMFSTQSAGLHSFATRTSGSWDAVTSSSVKNQSKVSLGLTKIAGSGSIGDASNTEYEQYAVSFLYDGYQESSLSTKLNSMAVTGDTNSIVIEAKIYDTDLSKRVTDILIYRSSGLSESLASYYRLVKQIKLDSRWEAVSSTSETGIWGNYKKYQFADTGTIGSSYESRTGFSETLETTMVNYGLSTQINNSHIVGKIYHSEIEKDADHYLVKSKTFKFDTFDWTTDFLRLPTVPTALAGFSSRLFAFDENTTYVINPVGMYIEDTFDGVGCLSDDSLVVTEYGMFFCNDNNLFMHNGKTPAPIGESIKKGSTNYSWQNRDKTYKPKVTFDSIRNSVMFFFRAADSKYYAWAFNLPRKRWDMLHYDDSLSPNSTVLGKSGEMLVCDSTSLRHFLGGSSSRQWEFESKEMVFGSNTLDKKFYTINLIGDSVDIAHTTTTGGSVGSFTAGVSSVGLSQVRGKTLKVKLKSDAVSDEVDAVGVLYRRLPATSGNF